MISLFIVFAILVVALWLTIMFLWWRTEEKAHNPVLNTTLAIMYWQKIARTTRRTWYGVELYIKQGFVWANKKVSAIFFRVFPNAEPAFAKKDTLAGLKDGPSSYFLLSITENQKKVRRNRTV